jgi:methylmalonyl-CoA/ethylmalonyl-CoA epimerase
MIKRVDHIGIVVKDLSKALAIYSKGFGLKPKEVREMKDVPLKAAVFQIGDLFIELIEYGNRNSETTKHLRGDQEGLNHVCYEVKELGESIRKLEEAGFQLVPGFPRGGVHGRIAFLKAPAPSVELIEILETEHGK